MPECPSELQGRHEADIQRLYERSIPVWVRAAVLAAIGGLVLGYFQFRESAASTYVTQQDLKDARNELRDEQLRTQEKLDRLGERIEILITKVNK